MRTNLGVLTTLGILLWEHEFQTGPERGWAYRAGQLFAPAYFGLTYFLDDDRRLFLARPLAAAAGAQWVGNNDIGLGVNAVVWSGRYYASATIMDGKANRKYPQLASLFDGQLLYLAEVGIERDRDGPREMAIRLTASHLDLDGTGPEKGAGQSVMISADRRLDGRFALFGRWSKSFERLSGDYRDLVSLGSAWLRPFGFTHDIVAFGVFRGRPSDPDRGDESGAELCYNLQLTQDLTVMPDVQYWSRHDPGGTRTSSWIGGLRVNFEF